MDRKRFLIMSCAALGLPLVRWRNAPASNGIATAAPQEDRPDRGSSGHLFIVGGAEDRKDDKTLLKKFVELIAGASPSLVVVTAASAYPNQAWAAYQAAFHDLGLTRVEHLEIAARSDANGERIAETVFHADGIFLTGGDQQRLMSMIGGTRIAAAIGRAFRERGICVGGTSAGAAAMSSHMMAEGEVLAEAPGKGNARMGAGLGLVPRAIIDQHFSQRQRLGRLLSLIAQAPFLIGVGIDENTALVIHRNRGLEVLGAGSVTIVDGRNMVSNFLDVDDRELLEMLNVKLHLLPSGARHYLSPYAGTLPDREEQRKAAPEPAIPEALYDVISRLTAL